MKIKSHFYIAAFAAASLCAAAPAVSLAAEKTGSSEKSGSTEAGGSKVHGMDETFAKNAADAGMAEVQLGDLATKNGESQAVKDFGSRMVTDHTKANDQLKSIASQKGIMLPEKISEKHQEAFDRLSKLTGAQFDKAYIKEMVKGHEHVATEFETASKEVKDADLKQFAANTLPTIKEHLKMARQINSELNGESSSKKGGAGAKKSTSGAGGAMGTTGTGDMGGTRSTGTTGGMTGGGVQ